MQEHRHLPESGKLSTVTASILLGYALLPFVQLPARQLAFNVFGVLIALRLNFYTLVSMLTAGMAASGTAWLILDHPHREPQSSLPNMILPALTAWAIGIPLGFIEVSAAWWIILGLGSLLVILVLVAEYISLDIHDSRYPLALMVLTAICYGLFLILSIAGRAAGLRLYVLLLLLPLTHFFICLRILQFRLGGKWRFEWSAVITLIVSQVMIALYYWPVSPVRFGLVLLGPAYALGSLAAALDNGQTLNDAVFEPLVMLGVIWVLALFIG
jgi:hypothetical protein